MFNILFFVIIFIVVYFAYYLIFENKLKKEKYTKISELVLLTRKFNLDKKKMNYKECLNGVAIINAFIIAFTVTIIDLLKVPIVFCMIVAFVMLTALIYSLYMLYGRYLSKKWGKKDGK